MLAHRAGHSIVGLLKAPAVAVILILSIGWVGFVAVTHVSAAVHHADGASSTPSCSWPLRVDGPASAAQVGLVRCYVRAVARGDLAALREVVPSLAQGGPATLTEANLAASRDADAGTAVATFVPVPGNSANVQVQLGYADGAETNVNLQLVDLASPDSWRVVGLGS